MSRNEAASEESQASAGQRGSPSPPSRAGMKCGLPFFLYFKRALFFPFLLIQRVSQTVL